MRPDEGYFFIFALLVGVVLGMLLGQPASVIQPDPRTQQPVPRQPQQPAVIEANTSTPLPQIFRQTKNSVVSIETGSGASASQGSGFVYDAQGHIVTNEHVVRNANTAEVTFLSGKQVQASVVGTDPYTDLAVLQVDPAELSLEPLPLGRASTVQVGERVTAIGNPFGLSGTMTAGIVSQKDRLIRTEGQFSVPNVLQTDAAINPGNSGGPLLNMQGEVIGVNTAISSDDRTFSGVGFAISVETVKRVVPRLISTGEYRHPWIGVSGVDVSPEIQSRMNLPVSYGFLVVDVVKDSPAARAGLQAGERQADIEGRTTTLGGDVIVGIDGNRVRKIDDILNYLATETSVGDTVTLTVIRDGEREQVELALARRPQPGE